MHVSFDAIVVISQSEYFWGKQDFKNMDMSVVVLCLIVWCPMAWPRWLMSFWLNSLRLSLQIRLKGGLSILIHSSYAIKRRSSLRISYSSALRYGPRIVHYVSELNIKRLYLCFHCDLQILFGLFHRLFHPWIVLPAFGNSARNAGKTIFQILVP